jgi:serine/threonine protein kinase
LEKREPASYLWHSLQVTLVVWLSSFSVDRIAQKSLCDLPSHSINVPQIATKVIHILQNIHKHGLSHNDIKPDHIVFDSQGLFLIDFGACTKLGSEIPFTTQKFCPNRALLAQESVCSVFLYLFTLQDPTVDFGALWYSLVSLYQKLLWDSPSVAPNTKLIMKLDYQPDQFRWKDSHLCGVAEQFSHLLEI